MRTGALDYHEETKHTPRSIREGGSGLNFDNKPTPYKTYTDLPKRALADRIHLPQQPALAAISEATPDGDPDRDRQPDRETVTTLCYYAAGITKEIERRNRTHQFRAAATTGALYHVDLYVVCGDLGSGPTANEDATGDDDDDDGGEQDAEDALAPTLPAGVYHFDPRTCSLDVLREGDYRHVLGAATARDADTDSVDRRDPGTDSIDRRDSGTDAIGRRDPGDGERVPLDPVDHETASQRPIHRTIRRRGSCREYEDEPISFRKLSTVLDRAVRGVPMDVRGGERGEDAKVDVGANAPPLSFVDPYLIVNGVEDLDSGSYHYHPAAGELERLEVGTFRQEARRLALDQRLGGTAAVCLYFLTDLADVVDAFGDRGYRAAQLEAALTAGRLYLGTYAHRVLGGTGLTFYDDLVTDFFAPRAAGQTPMFLYTMGRPA